MLSRSIARWRRRWQAANRARGLPTEATFGWKENIDRDSSVPEKILCPGTVFAREDLERSLNVYVGTAIRHSKTATLLLCKGPQDLVASCA